MTSVQGSTCARLSNSFHTILSFYQILQTFSVEKLNRGSRSQLSAKRQLINGRDKFQEKCGPTWNFRAIWVRKENHQCSEHVSADTSDNLSSHLLVDCQLSVDKLLAGSIQTVTVSRQFTWGDDDWCCYVIDNRSRFGQK